MDLRFGAWIDLKETLTAYDLHPIMSQAAKDTRDRSTDRLAAESSQFITRAHCPPQ
jgi:hypothetical protein